ncbi:MAG: MBOAT family protein [Deltaproteobacteria bacterium]|nr:MBOAT family protein [Deltaproteobacteria bacterium]
MLFLDPWFWRFAAIAILGYWILPRPAKLVWLIATSATFHYHFAGPAGMAPIIALGVFTYFAGLRLARNPERRLFWIAMGMLGGALGFYKYAAFLLGDAASAAGQVFGAESVSWLANWKNPIAPLAISFFTFEFVHYLYEVRSHGRPPIRNPLHFTLFAIFFPTLASGPIKRYVDFVPQLEALENPGVARAWAGAQRVVLGLFKKICLADLIVEFVTVLDRTPVHTPQLIAVLAVLQGFRIYFDFAGYSDMAIGLAQMFGLRVPENFDRPYRATSLQDFWRRWHMSLSLWIRDYIYIPMGGNRGRQQLHILVAMAICGLWHGAAWNFVAWGLYHGLGLGVESIVRNRLPGLFSAHKAVSFLRWIVCYSFVTYGWLLFFYPMATVIQMNREAYQWCFAP